MGVLQNSINTMIGSVGIAAKLTPAAKTGAQARELKAQGENLAEQLKAVEGSTEPPYKGRSKALKVEQAKKDVETAQLTAGITAEAESVAKQMFQLKPSEETYKAYEESRSKAQEYEAGVRTKQDFLKEAQANLEKDRLKKAQKKALGRGEAKALQTEQITERRSMLVNAQGENILVKENKNGG